MGGSFFGPPQMGGNITSGADTDFDSAEVLVTDIPPGNYILIVSEKTANKLAVWAVENTTLSTIYVNAAFSTTKDNASTYNVYSEGGFIKVQNNVGNNKSIAVGWLSI